MRLILLLLTTLITLQASPLTLTLDQEKDWHIKTQQPTIVKELPIGAFIAKVITPPHYLHAITLPFEAQVTSIQVAPFQQVTQGETLATVSSQAWIEAQQHYIQDHITYQHQLYETQRKQQLCREEIIPKKECTHANNKTQTLKAQLASSKALLTAYGATTKMLKSLSQTARIQPTLSILSPESGTLTELTIHTGKSISPDTPLMMLQKEGALWLEIDIPATQARALTKGQTVTIELNGKAFESQLLLKAPTINPSNQTQTVRFTLPKEEDFIAGLKAQATLYTPSSTIKVSKASVISEGEKQIVFTQIAKGYEATEVTILGEDSTHYYLQDTPALQHPIVTTSVAILKSMMESEDE